MTCTLTVQYFSHLEIFWLMLMSIAIQSRIWSAAFGEAMTPLLQDLPIDQVGKQIFYLFSLGWFK